MIIQNKNYMLGDINFLDDVKNIIDPPKEVSIYDLTLREGDQTPGAIMRKEEKFAIALEEDKLGVDFIEVFPAVSKDDQWVVHELVTTGALKHSKVSVLVRPRTIDLELAVKTKAQHIFLEGPGNMIAAATMGYKDIDEVIQSFVDVVGQAHDAGMSVTACPWDIAKADLEIIEKWVRRLSEAGAEDICYADTFGYTMPWTTYYMIKKYQEWAGPDKIISTHFHNDYGLATGSTLAGVAAGAKRVQVGFNSLGERAGNTSLEEVAVNLEVNMGISTGLDLSKLYPLSKLIEKITKKPVDIKRPVVGEESFMIGSGIVAELIARIDDPNGCLPFNPAMVGRPPHDIVFGKGAGKGMVKRFVEKLGIEATDEQIGQILVAVKDESLLTKSLVDDYRVEQIARDLLK